MKTLLAILGGLSAALIAGVVYALGPLGGMMMSGGGAPVDVPISVSPLSAGVVDNVGASTIVAALNCTTSSGSNSGCTYQVTDPQGYLKTVGSNLETTGAAMTDGTYSDILLQACKNGTCFPAFTPVFPLSASANGRYLLSASGQPFPVVGDAVWSLNSAPALNGATGATVQNYMSTRSNQGFNAAIIQILCANYCGNSAHNDGTDGAGNKPFTGALSSGTGCTGNISTSTLPDCYDLATPNPIFFNRFGTIVNMASGYNILAVLMTIDPSGCGSNSFFTTAVNNGATKLTNFGTYLANGDGVFPGFKRSANIMWLGTEDFQCWQTTADDALFADVLSGIKAAGDTHLIAAELNYVLSTTKDDTFASGVGALANINGIYSYWPAYLAARHAYNQAGGPAIVLETFYEWNSRSSEPSWAACPSPVSPGSPCVYESTMRKQEWWNALSGGAAGELWGNGYAGFIGGPGGNWFNYLNTEGATEFANYMKTLLAANQWWNLVPDQTSFVLTNPGTPVSGATFPDFTDCANPCITGNKYSTAASAQSALGSTVIAYDPGNGPNAFSGLSTVNPITINMTVFASGPTCQWFDPTNGVYTSAGSGLVNTGTHSFTPSGTNSTGDTDWVLLCVSVP